MLIAIEIFPNGSLPHRNDIICLDSLSYDEPLLAGSLGLVAIHSTCKPTNMIIVCAPRLLPLSLFSHQQSGVYPLMISFL